MKTIDIGGRRVSIPDLRTIAKGLAVVMPLAGIVGVVGPYVLGLRSIAILATYVAVPCLLAPVLYRYTSGVETESLVGSRSLGKLLLSAFFVLQAVSVVVLATYDVRPHGYYALVAAMAVVVLAQILWFSPARDRAWPILAQLVVLHLNLVWGMTLKYHYFIGRTDVFGHVYYLESVLATNGLPNSGGGFYEAFPLWHVLGGMEHLLFGGQVAPRTTFFLVSGLLYAILPVVVYLVADRLFDSTRVALTAGLLTALSSTAMHNGMYAIPRSAAAFLSVFLLLTWVRGDERSVYMFALFAVAIAAYHTVSLPFAFVILAIDYVFRRHLVPALSRGVVPQPSGASFVLLGVVGLVQAGYWLFFADYLLEHIVSLPFQQSPPGQVNTGVVEAPLRELANYLHDSALLVFIFVGSLVGLSTDRASGEAKATLLTALATVGLAFPGPHLLVERLAESFNVLRFSQYAFPFVAMGAAYGVVALFRGVTAPRPTAETIKVVALVVFVVFSFGTVSNDFVASDNPAVERQFYTNYISESEERSLQSVAGLAAGNVSSDYVGTRYYEASEHANDTRILGVSEDADELYLGNDDDLVLIREGELQRRPLQVWATDDYPGAGSYLGGLRYVDRSAGVWADLAAENRVYDSGSTAAYQRSNATAERAPGD